MSTEFEQMSIRYKDVFGSENGMKVLKDLDIKGLYHREIYVEESSRKTDFNLGANWVIRYIHSMIDKNLMDEQKQEVINEGVQL